MNESHVPVLEEISPELFLLELYNPYGLYELDAAMYVADRIGYCDASRLMARPKPGEIALMMEWEDGTKFWCHANERILNSIRERLERRRRMSCV